MEIISEKIQQLQQKLGINDGIDKKQLDSILASAKLIINNRNNSDLQEVFPVLYVHIKYGIPQNYLLNITKNKVSNNTYYALAKALMRQLKPSISLEKINERFIDFLAGDKEELKECLRKYKDFRDIIVAYNIYMKRKNYYLGFLIKEHLYGLSELTFREHKKMLVRCHNGSATNLFK